MKIASLNRKLKSTRTRKADIEKSNEERDDKIETEKLNGNRNDFRLRKGEHQTKIEVVLFSFSISVCDVFGQEISLDDFMSMQK